MVLHTIYPDKDSAVKEWAPTTNYGSNDYISVAQVNATNGIQRALLEFDISGLLDVPIDFISSCTLNIYESASQDPRTIDFRRIDNGAWTESGVTWNNQPSSTDYNLEDNWSGVGWKNRSIISILRDALRDGHSYIGILLKYTDESYDSSLDYNELKSKESATDPYLTIAYDTYSQCNNGDIFCKNTTYKDGWGEIFFKDHNCPTGSQVELNIKCPWGTIYNSVFLNTDKSNFAEYSNGSEHYKVTVYFFTCNSATCDNLAGLAVTECYWKDDCYVKTTGDNDRNGRSWAEAWSTVHQGANEAFDGQEVHIGFGTYNTEPANNDITPVNFGTVGIKYTPEAVGGGGTGSAIIEVN